jgi:hypothetical protein
LSPSGEATPRLTASRYFCSRSSSVDHMIRRQSSADDQLTVAATRINNSPRRTWRWLLRWYSVSPGTAIALSTDLGVASAMAKEADVGGSSGQRKKGLAVSRALTVCAAELGHGEHEAVVELACPPEPRPGGLAVPVLLLLTTQRRHFQRAHRGASYRSKRSSVGGVASMRSRSSGGRSSSRRRDDDDSGGCFYRGDTESSSSSSRSTPGQAATAAAG